MNLTPLQFSVLSKTDLLTLSEYGRLLFLERLWLR